MGGVGGMLVGSRNYLKIREIPHPSISQPRDVTELPSTCVTQKQLFHWSFDRTLISYWLDMNYSLLPHFILLGKVNSL